nr:hypothetical protein [Alkalicoccobacillus plakortidis]
MTIVIPFWYHKTYLLNASMHDAASIVTIFIAYMINGRDFAVLCFFNGFFSSLI